MAQQKQIQLVSMRMQVRSSASLSRSRIQRCHELWYKSQMWLESRVAVALWLWCRLAAVTLICPLAWKLPYATSCGPKKQKKKVPKLGREEESLPKWNFFKHIYLMGEILNYQAAGEIRVFLEAIEPGGS